LYPKSRSSSKKVRAFLFKVVLTGASTLFLLQGTQAIPEPLFTFLSKWK
jgi:hypothetical protein